MSVQDEAEKDLGIRRCRNCHRILSHLELFDCILCEEPEGADKYDPTLPQVSGGLECSLNEFERRCRWWIKNEQQKPNQNTAIIGLLADGVRLKREYCDRQRAYEQEHLNSFPPKHC